MKKVFVYFLLVLSVFTLTACESSENKDSGERVPVNLKEVNGPVVKAKLNDEGKIVIKKDDITTTAIYISYDVDGVVVGLIAVRDSNGDIRVVVNTCESCGGAPYAFFVQEENRIQCQNCGNYFEIDGLGELDSDGCNPIAIKDREDTDDEILVGTDQLKELKDKFENWKGPKA